MLKFLFSFTEFVSSLALFGYSVYFWNQYFSYIRYTKYFSQHGVTKASFWDFKKEFYARDWTFRDWDRDRFVELSFLYIPDASRISPREIRFKDHGMILNPINYLRFISFLRFIDKTKKKQEELNKAPDVNTGTIHIAGIGSIAMPPSLGGTGQILTTNGTSQIPAWVNAPTTPGTWNCPCCGWTFGSGPSSGIGSQVSGSGGIGSNNTP